MTPEPGRGWLPRRQERAGDPGTGGPRGPSPEWMRLRQRTKLAPAWGLYEPESPLSRRSWRPDRVDDLGAEIELTSWPKLGRKQGN
ncbi:hypothetical protein NDU88_009704 [Pleurodeles waltl]|uniref:Uncharacterized protein n=1 Tax=Pleurodeles waltl TaxID=8319 RepID=A0AAV7PSV9_PLEWA|nr:hypothetical protein NDU88_009704 [Pleurodeles waltl]